MYVCTQNVTQVYECVTIYSKGDLVIRREKSMSQPMLQRAASLSLPRAASMRRSRAGSQDSGELEVTPRSVRTIRNNSLICHIKLSMYVCIYVHVCKFSAKTSSVCMV